MKYFYIHKNKISDFEIIVCLGLFVFMILHQSYRGGILTPITLLTLPYLSIFIYLLFNRNIERKLFNRYIFFGFLFFYIGLKIYRGMANIGTEGDRDDALYQSTVYFINGVYPYDIITFLGNDITTVLSLTNNHIMD
jgi:hypothetical protein